MSFDGDAYLPESRIQFIDEPIGWREAVRMVGAPLVAEGIVTEGYVDGSISIAEEKGPFYDLGRGIAMPHARPELGAKAIGLSFLRCRQPINLLDREDHPIDVFIMLAATDSNTHLEMLQGLATVLIDADRVERMKAATTPAEVLAVFTESQ